MIINLRRFGVNLVLLPTPLCNSFTKSVGKHPNSSDGFNNWRLHFWRRKSASGQGRSMSPCF